MTDPVADLPTPPLPPPGPAPAPAPTLRADTDPERAVPTGIGEGWHALSAAAARLAAIGGGAVGLFAGGAAGVGLGIAVRPGFIAAVAMAGGLAALGMLLGALLGRKRSRRVRWRLDDIGLTVRRGLIWHSELLVPRSRVQHLDLERGPIERSAGLATLIVHTAGTRMHALRQSGFADADAVALRDALLPARDADDDVL
jgi:membrane protein YdbS with pleckstrin-like domain